MAGTKAGGAAAARTNVAKYGEDFYSVIGTLGGQKGRTGGFYQNRELARYAGAIGGRISSRRPGLTDEEKWALRQSPAVLKAYKRLQKVRQRHYQQQGRELVA